MQQAKRASKNGSASLSHSELIIKAKQQAAETTHWQLQISPRSPARQLAPEFCITDELSSLGLLSSSQAYGSPSKQTPSPNRRIAAHVMTSPQSGSPSRRSPGVEIVVSPRRSPEREFLGQSQRRSPSEEQLDDISRHLFSTRAALNDSGRRRVDQACGDYRLSKSSGTLSTPTLLPSTSIGLFSDSSASPFQKAATEKMSKRLIEDSELPVVPKINTGEFPLLEVSRDHAVLIAVEEANKKMKDCVDYSPKTIGDMGYLRGDHLRHVQLLTRGLEETTSPCRQVAYRSSLPRSPEAGLEHSPNTIRTTSLKGSQFGQDQQTRGLEVRYQDHLLIDGHDDHHLRIISLERELLQAKTKIQSLSADVSQLRLEKAWAEEKQQASEKSLKELKSLVEALTHDKSSPTRGNTLHLRDLQERCAKVMYDASEMQRQERHDMR